MKLWKLVEYWSIGNIFTSVAFDRSPDQRIILCLHTGGSVMRLCGGCSLAGGRGRRWMNWD